MREGRGRKGEGWEEGSGHAFTWVSRVVTPRLICMPAVTSRRLAASLADG